MNPEAAPVPSGRPPAYVWITWGLTVLDLIVFFAVLAELKWGSAHDEGALGCMAATGIVFLPLLALAGISTYLWRRRLWKELQAQLELKAKARKIRDREKESE